MLVQLLQRKAKRKQMLQRVAGQRPRQAFAADSGDLGGVVGERGVGRFQARRQTARA
jgi:hypothetical protein